MGVLAEIFDVSPSLVIDQLAGAHLDYPKRGSKVDPLGIGIIGWALGRDRSAVAVEVREEGRLLQRSQIRTDRPDVAAAFPNVADASRAGFSTVVRTLPMGAEFELDVAVVLEDGVRVSLGKIRGRRYLRQSTQNPALVSIIIPCFNQAHFLSEAIESALNQTWPHIEIVVVDDGSTDNTSEVAARYAAGRCVRQDNQGLAAARNTGLRCSNGDYLIFLDADDRLLPEAAETGLQHLDAHPEWAFVSGGYRIVAEFEAVIHEPFPVPENGDFAALLRNCYIGAGSAVLYRRAVFEHVQGFRSTFDETADYDLYLRIARDFAVGSHDRIIVEYRKHGLNMTQDPARMLKAGMSVLSSQRGNVRSRDLKRAYRDGKRLWRRYYGSWLAHEVKALGRERRWREAAGGLRTLARHDPRDVLQVLRGS